MELDWSPEAFDDLDRLYAFLVPKSRSAADRALALILDAPNRLIDLPRMGERVPAFTDTEVRRIFVGQYELRYQLDVGVIRVLRIFHTREDR